MAMTAYDANQINQASGYATAAKPPRTPNFADRVDLAAENVQSLVNRIEALAERLCGSVPTDANGGLSEVPNGVFNSVMERADIISRLTDEGNAAVSRIERSLP